MKTLIIIVGVLGMAPLLVAPARRRRQRLVRARLASVRDRRLPTGPYRLTVVVPVYREPRIGETVLRLRAGLASVAADGGVEIVVVDDGSGDDTAERPQRPVPTRSCVLPSNRGKGAAVRAGMLAGRGRTLAFTDADLSYSPDQLIGLMDTIESGWDVVVGSRDHERSATVTETSRLRRIGHTAVASCTRLLLLGGYRDTQCGLKAFRADAARRLFSNARVERFAFDIEILHLVERYALSATEVPAFVDNSERSTVRVARDASRLIVDLARIIWWAHRGHYDQHAAIDEAVHGDLIADVFSPGDRPVHLVRRPVVSQPDVSLAG